MIALLRFLIMGLVASGLLAFSSAPYTASAQNQQSQNNAPCPSTLIGGIDCVRTNIASQDKGLYQGTSAGPLLKSVILWLLSLVAVLALLALIVGGIMYIISFGDESRAERAKKIILYAIVGLLIVGASFVIIQAIANFLSRGTAQQQGGGGGGGGTGNF